MYEIPETSKSDFGTGNIAGLLDFLRDYADRRINSSLIDERRYIPPYIVLDFGNRGLLGLQAPVNLGGLALSNEDCVSVLGQLAAIDTALATFLVVHNFLGVRPIMNYGSDCIRDELLPKLASGRELGAFALTEPGAGSNPAAIESQAVLMPNGRIRLNGSKMWIGNASWAGVINVFLRYSDETGVAKGTCGYVIRQDAPGLIMGPELRTLGMRGMVQNVFAMENLEVDSSSQLGEVSHGMEVAQDAMMHTRLALGGIFLGGMKRCLQLMVRYAERRTTISTGRLLDNPVTLIRTSGLIAKVRVLENLLLFVSRRMDQSLEIPMEFLIVAKVAGSEFLWEAADTAIQLLGARGFTETNVVSQILRDSRVGRIFEGPTETMLHYLGTRLMFDNAPLIEFLTNSLQAKDVAERLLETCETARQRCLALDTPFAGRRRLDLANYQLGSVVLWGLLFAVTRNVKGSDSFMEEARVLHWAKETFDNAISLAVRQSADEGAALASSEIINLVNGYMSRIGNIEQALPGEEWGLDAYLRRREC